MKFIKVIIIAVTFLLGVTAGILALLFHHRNIEKITLTDDVRKKTQGSYIKLPQGVTHYEIAGPDSGKVVILVNGFSVPYYIWDGTYEYLVGKGYRVLRYDAYGRGFSDRPDVKYDKNLYLSQIHDLVTGLSIKAPFNVVGVSFGGEVITDFTCQYPDLVKKVVLVDPAFINNYSKLKSIANFDEAIHAYKRAIGQLNDFKFPQKHADWVNRYMVQMRYRGFRNALVSTTYDYTNTEKQSLKCLNATQKPVLLVWGEDDQTASIKNSDSIRSILKTDFFRVKDAGHLPFIEQPDTVNPRISAFLND
jgi:pimeloyl-ACP methyl ester carboxylesterase